MIAEGVWFVYVGLILIATSTRVPPQREGVYRNLTLGKTFFFDPEEDRFVISLPRKFTKGKTKGLLLRLPQELTRLYLAWIEKFR